MLTTLFNSQLSEREFSSHLLHTGDLLAWAESKRLHLRSKPDLNNFEFVQVEALLCAIEHQTQDLTPEQAVEIVLNHPLLKNDPAATRYPDDIDPNTCRWLLGADAHQKWRVLLTGAIQRHELSLLDFASKLPIEAAPAPDTATPAPVVDIGISVGVEPDKAGSPPVEQGLPTKDIAACFGDCYYSADNWPKRLSGTAWLKTACIGKGEIGGASAVWNPLTLAQLMHSKTKGDKAKEKLMKTLNSRFTRNPALGLWRAAFNEYFATHCATD